jgi:nitrite reductase/ring-hydroxylating ferredoxin subunit
MDDGNRITGVEDVPHDTTFLFTVRETDTGEQKEALLVRTGGDDAIHGWLNYCQHFTHIHLDKGDGAVMRDGEIICQNHGAWFESDSGLCTFGPCEGAYLNDIEVAVADGDVYLTDDDYAFVGVGPAEGEELDLSSESNLEF